MSELVFILTDFFPRPSDAPPVPRARGDALPRLPALERLLSRGSRTPLAEDWRTWLTGQLGDERAPPHSLAATVAAAWGELSDASLTGGAARHWLATPVHLFAGLDSVHLHPQGLLQLSELEQQQLVAQFNAVFADSGWRLQGIGQRELLMSGPPLQASGADPARFVGADPFGGLPQGPDAASLKRLGAELELWLFEHPLNRQREALGALPITTLWLWGSSSARRASGAVAGAAARAPTPLPQLFGRDTYVEALWRLRGAAAAPLPSQLRIGDSASAARTSQVVLYSIDELGDRRGAWQRLEQQWLAPAIGALRMRRIRALQLLAGGERYRLSWLHLGRFWRGRAPWWELLA